MGKGRNAVFLRIASSYRAAIQPDGELLPPGLWVARELRRSILPVPRIGDDVKVGVQKTMSLGAIEVLVHRAEVQPEQLGDGFRVRSPVPPELNEWTVQRMLFWISRQLGVWTQAVDGRGLELVLPTALRRPLAVELLLFVSQGPQLLVGEAVPLEMPDDLGQRVPPFASGGGCQICGGRREVEAGTVKQLAVGRDLVVADVLGAIPRRPRQQPEQFAREGGLFHVVLHLGFLRQRRTPWAVTGATAQGANPRFRSRLPS